MNEAMNEVMSLGGIEAGKAGFAAASSGSPNGFALCMM
jgi:hypothetical protein